MNLKKPDFWLKKNILTIFLLPLTIITNTINFIKKFSIKKNLKLKQYALEIFMSVVQAKLH